MRLNQNRRSDGSRSPHKRLLTLLALGRLARTGSSQIVWSDAARELPQLLAEFGPPSTAASVKSAAYPFTRLRNDGVWTLSAAVPDDDVTPLRDSNPVGRFTPELEVAIITAGDIAGLARRLAEDEFPPTVVPDLLIAVGFDPDTSAPALMNQARRRSSDWPRAVLAAWDRQCAFCGFDGQLGGQAVGIDAAHVRWFTHDGPDELDNGLALCTLHHKLLDRGVLGLDEGASIVVSTHYSARTEAGRHLYDLHGRALQPRPGSPLPAADHLAWHRREVFRHPAIAS
ncbi:phosphorothioated DNA-binding restriction endonuclease [Sporichthya polymorpha]|uniref:phosphorothioated DNA-binding restriction endonuclease n=1 Tax=Sporichthya polymorpha TaxID=35751 RepID=UPI000360970C